MNNVKDTIYNIKELTKRNMIIFFKNKTTIFFSLIAPILILIIYIIFLSDMQVSNIKLNFSNINLTYKEIKSIVDAWVISGIIGISSLTVSLNSMFIQISDRERNIINDFKASPVKSFNLVSSYFISSFIITFLLTSLFLIFGHIYLLLSHGQVFLFSFIILLKILGLLIISSLSSVVILIFITSFFNKTSTAASFTGIFTALIGFLIGAYLPVSMLPKHIASIANLIPGSQATSLYRNIFMGQVLSNDTILNKVDINFINNIKNQFGYSLYIFNYEIKPFIMVLYLFLTSLIFFIINILINKLKRRA